MKAGWNLYFWMHTVWHLAQGAFRVITNSDWWIGECITSFMSRLNCRRASNKWDPGHKQIKHIIILAWHNVGKHSASFGYDSDSCFCKINIWMAVMCLLKQTQALFSHQRMLFLFLAEGCFTLQFISKEIFHTESLNINILLVVGSDSGNKTASRRGWQPIFYI